LQYTFTPENPLRFFVYKLLTYSVIVVLYVMAARERRRNLGGHASFRSLVQVLVITITITEIFLTAFNYVYLNYIDPQWTAEYTNQVILWMEKSGLPQAKIDEQIDKLQEQMKQYQPTLGTSLVNLGMYIILDSIVGFVIANVLKRNPPFFEPANPEA
jgi:nitrogen fixation/metabolism regulation signal transduction histidine kinase